MTEFESYEVFNVNNGFVIRKSINPGMCTTKEDCWVFNNFSDAAKFLEERLVSR